MAVAFNRTSKINTATAGGPKASDHSQLDPHRQQDFDRVKTQTGGDVKLEIGMMHAVQPPQNRHCMKHDMLQIDDPDQEQRSRWNCGPTRHIDDIEKPPTRS